MPIVLALLIGCASPVRDHIAAGEIAEACQEVEEYRHPWFDDDEISATLRVLGQRGARIQWKRGDNYNVLQVSGFTLSRDNDASPSVDMAVWLDRFQQFKWMGIKLPSPPKTHTKTTRTTDDSIVPTLGFLGTVTAVLPLYDLARGRNPAAAGSATHDSLTAGTTVETELVKPTPADWDAWWNTPQIQWAANTWLQLHGPCTPDATCLATELWGMVTVEEGGCRMATPLTMDISSDGSLDVSPEHQEQLLSLLGLGTQMDRWHRRP